jgi:hypothetical protein
VARFGEQIVACGEMVKEWIQQGIRFGIELEEELQGGERSVFRYSRAYRQSPPWSPLKELVLILSSVIGTYLTQSSTE